MRVGAPAAQDAGEREPPGVFEDAGAADAGARAGAAAAVEGRVDGVRVVSGRRRSVKLHIGWFTVELDARLIAEWEAAERVSLFDGLVASGVPVCDAVCAVHAGDEAGALRILNALLDDESGELPEARA